MTACAVQASGAIELLFYGELDGDERARIEEHLRTCVNCQHALDDLFTIREALASRPDVASPPGGDWSAFMIRLEDAVARDAAAIVHASGVRGSAEHARPEGRAYGYLAIAAVLTLVTIVVLLLARQRDDLTRTMAEGPASPTVVESAPRTPEPVDPALVSVGEQHFERSKLVVLGLATKDPADAAGANWAYERELASALLDDTRLYRMAAEERGMRRMADVMRDLELLLLEASMSERPDAESLESLQQLIRRRDLLTKMEVVKTSGL